MKKIFLQLTIIFLSFTINLLSQTFTFVRTSPAIVYNSSDSMISSYGLINVTSSSITLICKKYKFVPNAWTVSYCINVCYPPTTDSSHEHLSQGQHLFTFDFIPFDTICHPGTGYAAMVMFDSLHPSTKDSVIFGATAWPISIKPISSTVREFKLEQNYPNPFNPSTTIRFSIHRGDFTSLKIYNIFGQEVATLVNQNLQPGNYEIEWDSENFSSGTYFYRLITPNNVAVKKMVLVK